ncbi:GGDEF domain-containing protein [Silvimonas amylolytica]|uniref:diguanylate cyclase n=1 Tax=Silvimonas amylolytica TaxID=449663 RepID=A0ABQ2PH30_9NEIS|nr:GGDEF domain-containing protein [Silvimonas amylolytica]GGP24618.1 GGDEF domain-containing protein [Silvimonas amylolytica]
MRIKTRFVLYITAWTLTLATLLGWLAHKQWTEYAQNRRAVGDVERAQLALKVFEMVSRERGPANAIMGAPLPAAATQAAALATARARSDTAIHALLINLQALDDDANRAAMINALLQLQDDLQTGRRKVNAVAAMPVAQRPGETIDDAVSTMISVATLASPLSARISAAAEQHGNTLNDLMVAARAAAELREQAGQLGSQFTRALIRQEPLTRQTVESIERIVGHIDIMRMLVNNRVARCCADNPNITGAVAQMNQHYFGDGQTLVNQVLVTWHADVVPQMTTGEFAARYVPTMNPILDVRDALLLQAARQAMAAQTEARDRLVWLALLTAMLALLLIVPLCIFGYRLLNALTTSADIIKALAAGRLDTPVPQPARSDEIGDVLSAIAVLRDNSRARQVLQVEREALIAELHEAATTDFLTGALNRRAFQSTAAITVNQTRRRAGVCSVALLDLDHFKQVNDTWGHDVGDAVIRAVSRHSRLKLRSSDLFARYGGEEFIFLLADANTENTRDILERIRLDIAQATLAVVDERPIRLTVSVGFAVLDQQCDTLEKLVLAADRHLYEAKQQGRNLVIGTSSEQPQ